MTFRAKAVRNQQFWETVSRRVVEFYKGIQIIVTSNWNTSNIYETDTLI